MTPSTAIIKLLTACRQMYRQQLADIEIFANQVENDDLNETKNRLEGIAN